MRNREVTRRYPEESRRARRTRSRPGFPEARLPDPLARPARRRGPAALVVGAGRGRPGPPRHRGRRRRDQGHRRPSRCWSPPPCSPPSSCRCTTSAWSPGTASVSSPRPRWPGCSPPRPRSPWPRVRGREMAAACALEPTGMSAVLGGDPDEVLAAIEARRPVPGQPQRRRPDRRRRRRSTGLAKLAADAAGQGPGHRAAGGRRVPHAYMAPAEKALGRGRRRDHARRPDAGSCSPTPTAPPSTTAATMLARLVAPGDRAGALGPVHAHARRPRRHRA